MYIASLLLLMRLAKYDNLGTRSRLVNKDNTEFCCSASDLQVMKLHLCIFLVSIEACQL